MLVIKLILNLKITGLERKAIEGNLALKGLNASKTKVMHLNPTANNIIRSLNGDEIGKVDDFLYLGGYTNTTSDIKSRITKAWGALNSLTRIWCSRIKTSTKTCIYI